MSDKAAQEKCNCGSRGPTGGQSRTAGEDLAKVVRAQIPQDYEANFNIRLIPARGLESGVQVQPRCKPRGHVASWDHGALTIAPGLVATLNKANKVMIDWLARDTANSQRFLANPVAAMREAGVELSRAEEKALVRSHEAASATRFVGPGVKISSLSAQAYPNGKIGGLGSGRTDGKIGGLGSGRTDGKIDDFGCGPKRKG